MANYTLPVLENVVRSDVYVISRAKKVVMEQIDDASVIVQKDKTPTTLPLYHLLLQSYVENEVFTVPKLEPKTVPRAAGCL